MILPSIYFSNFESERFGTERYNENKKSGLYLTVMFLIIDDLGTELTNQFTTMILFNLINTRLNRKKAMIINTNLSLKGASRQVCRSDYVPDSWRISSAAVLRNRLPLNKTQKLERASK